MQEPFLTKFTKFRISAQKVHIETGRYKKLPANQRFCNCCSFNLVEDESPFSICWKSFDISRESFFKPIKILNKNFVFLNKEQNFVWLMSSEDSEVLTFFSKYLLEIYVERTFLLGKHLSGHWIVYYIFW